MHSQGREKRAGRRIHLGKKWTARTVVRETQKADLMKIIQEKHGVSAGTPEMFRYYQHALMEVVRGMTVEEMTTAKVTADIWNNMGATPEAQARYGTYCESLGDYSSCYEDLPHKGPTR
jgi:hypothetical protein